MHALLHIACMYSKKSMKVEQTACPCCVAACHQSRCASVPNCVQTLQIVVLVYRHTASHQCIASWIRNTSQATVLDT